MMGVERATKTDGFCKVGLPKVRTIRRLNKPSVVPQCKWKTEGWVLHDKHQWNKVFSNSRSGWNFNNKYFCSSEGETLSNLAKDLNEGNNCGQTECEHSRFCQKRKPWGKRRMKVNSQSFYWISSSIVLHVEMNSSEGLKQFLVRNLDLFSQFHNATDYIYLLCHAH